MTAPVLEARDLSISFGGLRAVDDVSIAAERNRITTIIGPNGAGKSTLFNLISGALRPQSGAVLRRGRRHAPARRLTACWRRAWRVRSRSPICCSTCRWRKTCGWRRRCWNARAATGCRLPASRIASARVAELLERFGLADKAALSVAQLSHGEQRRLEVAVALAGRPKVLLLDEPTQGMSHGDTQDTAALIRSLAAEVTVLLIEHDIGLVMNLSDHVIVMHQGHKLAEGTPASVRANPAVQTAYFGHA